jgi:hypothetical protein
MAACFESRRATVKIRRDKTENSPVLTSSRVCRQSRRRRAPEFGESSLTNPVEHRARGKVEADRLRLIEQRLLSEFYEVPPASERIAALVMAELQDLEEGASVLPN